MPLRSLGLLLLVCGPPVAVGIPASASSEWWQSDEPRQPAPLAWTSFGELLGAPRAAVRRELKAGLRTALFGSDEAKRDLQRRLHKSAGLPVLNTFVPEPPPSKVELCRLRSYMCDQHTVRTEDGFLLTMVRVVGKASSPAERPASRTPALLMHGNVASSDSWLLRVDDSNLALVLHEAGYDVWLGNFRGNTHSRSHVRFNDSEPEFWNWSFHEMGVYDMPAMVDYILARNDNRQLHILGHSMATNTILVYLSSYPELNHRVRLAVLMSPSYALRGALRMGTDVMPMARMTGVEENVGRSVNAMEFTSRSPLVHYFVDTFCQDNSAFVEVCFEVFEEVSGKSKRERRIPDLLPTISAYHPAGTSYRAMEHVGALSSAKRFGPMGRGADDPDPPPDYNVSAISAPVAMIYSTGDGIVDREVVERYAPAVPSLVDLHKIDDAEFNHMDFMWAKDARGAVYDYVLGLMKHFDARATAAAVVAVAN